MELRLIGTDGAGRQRQVVGNWQSSDEGILKIDAPGVMRATGVGHAFVVGFYGGRSDSIRVTTRPATLTIDVEGATGGVVVGQSYRTRATFRDTRGDAIDAPWPVEWSSSSSAQLELAGDVTGQTVLVRIVDTADVVLRATAGGIVVQKLLSSPLRVEDAFLIVAFNVGSASAARPGFSVYVPDLVVATGANVQVARITFVGGGSACGNAELFPHQDTPLFDFQPYNYVWTGPSLPIGTAMEARIHLSYPGGREKIASATTRLHAHTGVIDRGTDGFAWTECI
ncbi:MAG: hypothetical protein IT353_19985 [Gemmatimonadaceae bacterium]|nr:hypothetical protein [Gemmatimonadaceae bacterium]